MRIRGEPSKAAAYQPGLRERQRQQQRADFDRVAEKDRKHRVGRPAVILTHLRSDIEERAAPGHRDARARFYAAASRQPTRDSRGDPRRDPFGPRCPRAAARRKAPLPRAASGAGSVSGRPGEAPRGEVLRKDQGGRSRWYSKTTWSVDRWAQNTASHLFARLRPLNASDRATHTAMATAFKIFFNEPLSQDGVKKLVSQSRRS